MKQLNNGGFSLIELVIVLAIMAALVSVSAPSLVKYIRNGEKSAALAECRQAVSAAQVLLAENGGDTDAVTAGMIKEKANVRGTVSGVEAEGASLRHLTYTGPKWAVTYCGNNTACGLHDEMYNIGEGQGEGEEEGEGHGGEPPGGSGDLGHYFFLGGDENLKASTWGDLAEYDFGSGTLIPTGTIFYWQGDCYYTRDGQYMTNSKDREIYINSYGVKINKDSFVTPGPSTAPGDLKRENGKVYVFFPYARYQNDYQDPSYWFEVTTDN